jgi:hypothetical protein
MQDVPLITTNLLDYAARWHGESEVVSVSVEGVTETSHWRQVAQRAKLCALALKCLSVRQRRHSRGTRSCIQACSGCACAALQAW